LPTLFCVAVASFCGVARCESCQLAGNDLAGELYRIDAPASETLLASTRAAGICRGRWGDTHPAGVKRTLCFETLHERLPV
jgi:hypothetical protein